MRAAVETAVSYASESESWRDFPALVRQVAQAPTTRTVCEVGGGARPALDLAFVAEHGLDYTVMDISGDELAKAPDGYRKVQTDIAGTLPVGGQRYDLIFSKTLAEHVRDGARMHRNVFDLLTEGGTAIHMFPTLFAPAFVANMLLPTAVSRWLLTKVQGARRDDDGLEGKFPAYYRWCRGPSSRQLERFRQLGYEVLDYRGYYGTPGYYRPLRLGWLDAFLTRMLTRFPMPALTSYAVVVLRRPAAVERAGRP